MTENAALGFTLSDSQNMADANLELELQLYSIAELFRASELDPFKQIVDDRSGMEQILDELKANPSSLDVRVVLAVPADQFSDTTEAECRAAVVKYCEARARQLGRELAALQRRGIRALQIGLVFWGICLLLSILFFGMERLPDFVSHFFGEGFLIAGWVALWIPTETLLFERWEVKRERKYYERLQHITLQVRPIQQKISEQKISGP